MRIQLHVYLLASIACFAIIACFASFVLFFLILRDTYIPNTIHANTEKLEPEPSEIQTLKLLSQEFDSNEHRWDALISIGDVYRRGAYPRFRPNEEIASECFKICARCPDSNIAGIAQTKYIESITEKIHESDQEGKDLPECFGKNTCSIALNRIHRLPFHVFMKPKHSSSIPRVGLEVHDRHEHIHERHEHIHERPYVNTCKQNVHDHSVLSIAKTNLDKLNSDMSYNDNGTKQSRFAKTMEIVLDTIDETKDMSDQAKSDARTVLRTLGCVEHSRFGMSEQEIMSTVHEKILSEENIDLKKNLQETLCKQLASSIEKGTTVCSTGKCVRLLGTFDGTNLTEQLRPIEVLKEEISTLAAKIRTNHLEPLSDLQRTDYDLGAMLFLDEQMKTEFRSSCEEIYYAKLNMSRDILEPIITMNELGF